VDNECFYSDHLIKSKLKLASTQTILRNDPFFLKKKHQRLASFDLATFMRQNDYMADLRKDESRQGPLKIIKLPEATAPLEVELGTPPTLARLFHHSKRPSVNESAEMRDF